MEHELNTSHGWNPDWEWEMRLFRRYYLYNSCFREHPESNNPNYDLLVNSKSWFLYAASVCICLQYAYMEAQKIAYFKEFMSKNVVNE